MHADTAVIDPTDGNVPEPQALPLEQIAYNVPHAAKVLDLSERQMWELVRRGEVESFKLGASRRITRAALVAYIQARQDAA